jgi:Protein of unknown function (DUF4229)
MPASDPSPDEEPGSAPTEGAAPPVAPMSAGKALAIYTLLRLLLFGVCYLLLWALFRTWVPWTAIALLSLLITAVVSLLFLRRLGSNAGAAMVQLQRAGRDRLEAARSAEDVDDDDDPGNRGHTPADA